MVTVYSYYIREQCMTRVVARGDKKEEEKKISRNDAFEMPPKNLGGASKNEHERNGWGLHYPSAYVFGI